MELLITLYILLAAAVLAINGLMSSNASDIAENKGYDKKKWFHMCFWLGPLSYIMIAAMPDNRLREQQDVIIKLLSQQPTNTAPANAQSAPRESIESILPRL